MTTRIKAIINYLLPAGNTIEPTAGPYFNSANTGHIQYVLRQHLLSSTQ